MSGWDEAFERAQQVNERLDAFFERREADQRRKDAKRARRDGDESFQPEERSELRSGSLSKQE
jgi:hypothetical protein